MSNYTQTTSFTPKDSLLSGNPAKLIKGADFDVEFAAIAVAIATKLDSSQAANPTGTVGLTTVNGSASTYMRSDGAPALSQAIVPTWTGIHTFSVAPVLNAGATIQNNAAGVYSGTFNQTTAATSVAVKYQLQGVDKAYTGVVGIANDTITGSVANDYVFRTQGGNVLISTNNGSSIAFKVTSGALAQAVDQGGTLQDLGWRDAVLNTQAGIYTLALSDRGKMILAGNTVTIPANASVAFPVGTMVIVFNNTGAGISVAINTDTLQLAGTATTGTRTIAQNGVCTLLKWGPTAWFAMGPGVT